MPKQPALSLLCLSRNEPFGRENADGSRVAGLLSCLAAKHVVKFIGVVADRDRALDAGVPPGLNGIEVFQKPVARRSGVGRAERWMTAAASRMPPEVRANYVPVVASRLAETAADFDAVIFLDNAVSVHWQSAKQARRLVIDVHQVAGWSQTYARVPSRTVKGRMDGVIRAGLTRSFERRSLGAADAVVVTSEAEQRKLGQMYGIQAAAVVPSAAELRPALWRWSAKRRIGWMGNLGYGPNRDGLLRFINEGWPDLRERGCQLAIAGPGADPEFLGLCQGDNSIEVLGFVDELDEFLATLDAAVIPLWAGAGVKLKTVNFMSAGVPIVTTSHGAEGVALKDGVSALVADTSQGLSSALLTLVEQHEVAERVGRAGRRLVETRYTWPVVGPSFVSLVERLCESEASGSVEARDGGD